MLTLPLADRFGSTRGARARPPTAAWRLRRIALCRQPLRRTATTSATLLPALHLDRGVSGVTLHQHTTFQRRPIDVAHPRIDSGDGFVTRAR